MNQVLSYLKENFKIDIIPNTREYQILQVLNKFGLLNIKVFEINNSLLNTIERFYNKDYYNSILGFALAADEEFNFMACLTLEGFSKWGDIDNLLVNKEIIDIERTREVFQGKYNNAIGIQFLQNPNLKNYYEQPNCSENILEALFQILYKYCGNSIEDLDRFLDDEFQNFVKLLASLILLSLEKDSQKITDALNKFSGLEIPSHNLNSEGNFNNYFNQNFEHYLIIITKFLEHFQPIRQLTLNVIETYLVPNINEEFRKLEGHSMPSLISFEEFNNLLEEAFSKTEEKLEKNVRNKIKLYLENDFSKLKPSGGFTSLIVDQHNLVSKVKDTENGTHKPIPIKQINDIQLNQKAEELTKTLDNLAILTRLKFILSHIDDNSEIDESNEIWEKIAGIISSSSSTYYNDIFELYVYTVLKTNRTPISLLNSQTKGGKKVSTCDYKIGDEIAADCKCIISNKPGLNQISEHCNKIGKQIESTKDYKNIKFGGGIFGYRDRSAEFLESFSKFKNDEFSRISIINFAIEVYSEFRRNTSKSSQENIKFLFIYYLPNSNLTAKDLRNLNLKSSEETKEIFFLITTKYATQNEISKVKEAFKYVTPMFFQFNNFLSN